MKRKTFLVCHGQRRRLFAAVARAIAQQFRNSFGAVPALARAANGRLPVAHLYLIFAKFACILPLMSTDSVTQHRKAAPKKLRCAVMTLSTTRTKENDTGGGGIRQGLLAAGHEVVWYEILKDDVPSITSALKQLREMDDLDLIVSTGGTGLSPLDVTIEAVKPLFDKEIPAFAVMFAMLSHEQVGMACLLSRATAGVMKDKIVLCLPGSPKACALAMEKIILPEAGHLVKHARERPSNKECTPK